MATAACPDGRRARHRAHRTVDGGTNLADPPTRLRDPALLARAIVGNLRREAQARGIDPDRLIFAPRVTPQQHLARQQLADLMLDTLPYNAHTTASDALWAGLPVLTQIGETFAGRVAASLLTAIGLPELIARTPDQFESMAIELATRPERMAAIKRRLAENRMTKPLFDTNLYTRHIESAFATMHQRHQDGVARDHIHVAE